MPRRSEHLPKIVAGVVAAVFALTILYGGRVYRWAAERLTAPENLDEIDLRHVHAELFPDWMIAASHPGAKDKEAEAFDALRRAVEADGNLTALVDRLRALTSSGELAEKTDRALDTLAQWNGYLDEHDKPFQLSGGVMLGDQTFLYATSLEALTDVQVRVGGRDVRARVFQRIDSTNIVEPYLGASQEGIDGAVILTDRVLELALDRVWPVLDASVPRRELPTTALPFAAALRREVEAGLDASALEVLRRTAAARAQGVKAADAIGDRTHCSRFFLRGLPWQGLAQRDLDAVQRSIDDAAACPGATSGEFAALRTASEALAAEHELQPAVEALLAWATRVIVVHEARHEADALELGSLDERLDCSICGERDSAVVRAEASAYVASFAWSQAPTMAMFQACDAVSSTGGAHRRAMELVLDATDASCRTAVLPDPASTMKEPEQWAFDRSEEITLPADYPATLPLPVHAKPSG